MDFLSIGQLAQRAGVGVETVRFYEREGLLEEPSRKPSGYRQYDEAVIDRLRFIRHAKELGFTLNEIKELLSLRASPRASCGDIRLKAEEKVHDIDEKIKALRSMKKALAKLVSECSGTGSVTDCPILSAMDS